MFAKFSYWKGLSSIMLVSGSPLSHCPCHCHSSRARIKNECLAIFSTLRASQMLFPIPISPVLLVTLS